MDIQRGFATGTAGLRSAYSRACMAIEPGCGAWPAGLQRPHFRVLSSHTE